MGFFDKLLNYLKSGDSADQTEISEKDEQPNRPQVEGTLKDYIYQTYQKQNLDIELVRTQYLDNCLGTLLTNDYQKRTFEVDPEAFKEKYFLFLSISYLVYHFPTDDVIETLLNHLLKNGNSYYGVRELLRSRGRNLFSENTEMQGVVHTGAGILSIYHALYLKTDANFSYTAQVHDILNEARQSAKDKDFTTLLDIVTRRTTYETPWVLVRALVYKEYDYRTKIVKTHNDKKEEVLEKVQWVLGDFNQKYDLSLKIEDVSLIGEHIAHAEKSDVFLNTNYRNRKKLGLKDIPELSAFFNSAKSGMPTFMDAWMYYGSFYFTSDLTKLFKDITVNLLSSQRWSSSDFERWISVRSNIGKEHNTAFFNPVFEAYLKSEIFTQKLNAFFESYVFTFYGINLTKSIPKKVVAGLSAIADTNPSTLEREFMKLVYKSPISVSNLSRDSLGFYTSSKQTREEGIKTIHAQFSAYVPSSLKSVNSGQYYNRDRELFVLNIDDEDYHMPHAFSGSLNKILAENKTGVRMVPVPITQSRDHNENIRYVNALCLMNLQQFRYLTEQYLPSKFPDLKNARPYQSIEYINRNGEALHELNEQDTNGEETMIFSAGFANDVKWSWFKEAYTDKLRSKEKWNKAMDVLTQFTGTKKPSGKWVSDMNKVIDEIGETQYFDELGTLIHESREEKSWFFDEYNKTLKGMIWSCTMRSTERSLLIIKTVTELSYTKVPGIGPRSTKTGNFCLEALANSPSELAYGMLQLMRMKSKYPRFVRALDKCVEKYKENNKANIEVLEDKALPHFGFKDGVKIYDFIDAKLELSFKKGKMVKTYFVDGKGQKKIPPVLNQKHAARLKEVTVEIKQINEIFKGLHERLKTFWLYNRSWTFDDWHSYIFKHPLMNPVIENMVWVGVDSEELFVSKGDQLVQTNGATIELDKNEIVSLWHPVFASDAEREELKNYFQKNKLAQIEKQVDREWYTLDEKDLDKLQSNRFANQMLEVRKLMALANATGWTFTYVHEDVSWPRRYFKELDITAHFKCDYDRTAEFIPTAEFFFSKGDSTKISHDTLFEKLKMSEIHQTTLSEVCRDIDMFVSVANQNSTGKGK